MSKPIAILVVAAISLYGCSGNIEQETVRSIEIGTSRAEVEEILGEPVTSEETSVGIIHTYSFNIDANESSSLPDNYGGCVGPCAMAQLVNLPVTLLVDASGAFDEEKELHIVYGEDDRIIELIRFIPERDSPENAILSERQIAAQRGLTISQAQNGDPEAQYTVARMNSGLDRFMWLCRAAMNGHAKARFEMGISREYGYRPVNKDLVLAYVWYVLADRSGFEGGGTLPADPTPRNYWRTSDFRRAYSR